jgi:alpha-1,6-mannosyltransferase
VADDKADGVILARAVRSGGIAVTACAALLVFVSYGLAVFFPVAGRQGPTQRLLTSWVDALPLGAGIKSGLGEVLAGHSALAALNVRLAAYYVPVAIATVWAIWLLLVLARSSGEVDARVTRAIVRVSILSGILFVMCGPVFTKDLWLSVGWGRMVLDGVNPYDNPMSALARQGLPFAERVVDGVPVTTGNRMTYGPLWALVSAGIAALGGSSPFILLVVSKLVLFVAWLSVLLMTTKLAARSSQRDASMAAVVCGWLPLLPLQGLAEGHNDIVLLAMMVLWYRLAIRADQSRYLAPAALTAAVLLKYVAAPLAALDLIGALRGRSTSWTRYALAWLACAAGAVLVFMPFYSGPGMFSEVTAMRGWNFLSPADALSVAMRAVSGLTLDARLLGYAILAVGILIAVGALRRYARQPTSDTLATASLVILWMITFTAVGHTWPWFLMWPLPFAALQWRRPVGAAYIVVAAMAPLLGLAWFMAQGERLWTGGAGILFFGTCALIGGAIVLSSWSPDRLRHVPS